MKALLGPLALLVTSDQRPETTPCHLTVLIHDSSITVSWTLPVTVIDSVLWHNDLTDVMRL